jgi:hypothetical protein
MTAAATVTAEGGPACLEWDSQRFPNVAAVSGSLDMPQASTFLERLGSVSKFAGMTYWSVTERRIGVLITESFAVPFAQGIGRRPDYSIQEMQAGRNLFFSEHDNRLPEPVIYRLRILERDKTHLVVDISNVTPVKRFLMTVFSPGDLRTVVFVTRTAVGTWRCYAMSGVHAAGIARIADNPKSHLNRLLALYAYIGQLDPETIPWVK